MIHTGAKLASAANQIKQMGANEIYSFITHNLLFQQSFQKVDKLPLNELITTNTISNVIYLFID
jgi:phosphoribosylpyrophosphate synthetase